MTPENFIYWLQGKLEIGDTKTLNEQEVQVIKDHIALVLKKETPNYKIDIITDPKMEPGIITIAPQSPSIPKQPSILDRTDILKPRCQGGIGTCSRLGCSICNSSLIVTC